jgi:hypothetical protein
MKLGGGGGGGGGGVVEGQKCETSIQGPWGKHPRENFEI